MSFYRLIKGSIESPGEGLIWAPRRCQLAFTVPPFAKYLRESLLGSFDDG